MAQTRTEWDAEVADAEAERFAETLAEIEHDDPGAIARLREAWRLHYLKAGHKRLARVLLGSRSGGGR